MTTTTTVDRDTALATETKTTALATNAGTPDTAAAALDTTDGVRGRSAFMVESSAAGVVVRTVFAAEDGRVLAMPAVFPDVHYALEQIESLRRAITERFAQAAQLGNQLIANQMAQSRTAAMEQAAPKPTPNEG